MAGAATATRECRRNDKPIRPAPPACVVPLELDHFLYPSTNTPPRLPQPRQRGLRLLPRRFRHARHNTMVQTGQHPNDCCLRLFVRYISTRFRPTSADFIGATTAFLRPNWPHRHPAKKPTHAPTAPPPTPRATTALLRLPATSSSLTAAAATAKSPSDAAATATVVGATTVATTSDLRRPWRPHLPPGSQQVVELDHFILAVKGHKSATSTVLTRLPQLAGPERRRPASSMREFPLVGDTTSNVCTRVPFGVTAVGNIFGSKAP